MGNLKLPTRPVKSVDAPPPSGTQSIRRAIATLREVATYNQNGIRLVDLADHLQMERSTAHRILQCLTFEGLLAEKNPGSRYVLGPLAFELGLSAAKRYNLADMLLPYMKAIAKETGDVVFLSVRSGQATTTIARAEGDYPVKAYTRSIGDRRPLGFGCVGTIVLAELPDAKVKTILERNVDALRTYAGTTPEAAFAKVQQARATGFAFHERPTHGLKSVAAPVYDSKGKLIAVMSICALATRMQEDRMGLLCACLKKHCTAAAAIDFDSGADA